MAATRPHIVFILTDQQRYDTIGELGFPFMETPNLDRLAREGTAFTNCFIPAPSCCPSRASLFTGMYPHNTGVYKNGDRWTESWVADLSDVGYRCVNVGKMHTVPFTVPLGFHERYIVENKDRFLEGRYFFDEWDKALRARGLVKQQRELYRRRDDYGERLGAFTWDLDEDMQADNFVGGMARWWLETYPLDQPLFMQVGFPGPHPPYDPTPRWLSAYREKDLPIRQVSNDDLAGQPEALKALRRHMMAVDHDSVVHLEDPTDAQRHFQRACYLANVSMIDEQVGVLLDSLASQGMLDDTVVIFASDHGDCLGDHGHSQKWNMYEEVVRVPAIVWLGSGARKMVGIDAPPGRVDGLVSLMDFGPTVLDCAGVTPPQEMDAISLLPLLRGESLLSDPAGGGADSHAPVAKSDSVWDVAGVGRRFVGPAGRRYVFAEHGRDNILDAVEVMTMVRDEGWKLVSLPGQEDGQLYDLVGDPSEEENLFHRPEFAPKRKELTAVLADWLQESLYRTRATRRR